VNKKRQTHDFVKSRFKRVQDILSGIKQENICLFIE